MNELTANVTADPALEADMVAKLEALRHLPQEAFGIPEDALSASNWAVPVAELSRIDAAPLPSAKLKCVLAAANAVYAEAGTGLLAADGTFVSASASPQRAAPGCCRR